MNLTYLCTLIGIVHCTAFSNTGWASDKPLKRTIDVHFRASETITSRRALPRTAFGLKSSSDKVATDAISGNNIEASVLQQIERSADLAVSFSHIHLFVDNIEPLQTYKDLEESLNQFVHESSPVQSISEKQNLWASIISKKENEEANSTISQFSPQNRDVIKQLMTGFGFRITGYRFPTESNTANTKSLLICSKDPNGVQILVTAHADEDGKSCQQDQYLHFDKSYHEQFYQAHAKRQGIAVLGFVVKKAQSIYDRYAELHPDLIHSYNEYTETDGSTTKVLQVFSYYKETNGDKIADPGTLLRFIESNTNAACALPGLTSLETSFDSISEPAYCDHWVSNVYSRTDFWNTLEDVLGFGPKVDFNAGVVAAGEAQIESTVLGNISPFETTDKDAALKDQSQVFLPINNALSEVGHVHGFLKEMGQGVQHCASRVEDLVSFVQRCNDFRDVTGEGFTFLNIPRSYYGVLTIDHLMEVTGISQAFALEILEICSKAGVSSIDGAVDLYLTAAQLDEIFESNQFFMSQELQQVIAAHRNELYEAILSSRYRNLYALLGEDVTTEQYMGIVRNKILVDVQGSDILYQIFTCNILQRNRNEEAPFFEFIQRVCSPSAPKLKPGCGGFGIRNFLTLFLSIEVSKASSDLVEAKHVGDEERMLYAQRQVQYFTDQLNDSNPILNEISDAMTEEGVYQEELEAALLRGDREEAQTWKEKLTTAGLKKEAGNQRLMECSARYANLMKGLRESPKKAVRAPVYLSQI